MVGGGAVTIFQTINELRSPKAGGGRNFNSVPSSFQIAQDIWIKASFNFYIQAADDAPAWRV